MAVLAALPVWLALNAYALLLDGLAVMTGLASGMSFIRAGIAGGIIWGTMALLFLTGGIKVHQTYPMKLHLFRILIRRNARQINLETFRDYLDVPCLRLVVRTVLHHLGAPAMYRSVMRRYYRPPWRRDYGFGSSIHIFNSQQEAKEWISKRNSRPTLTI